MNRHLSRSVVLQTLFELDFDAEAKALEGNGRPRASNEDALALLRKNKDEFAPGSGDAAFMETLLLNVLAKKGELDAIIEKAAPEWPIDKISVIDRNVLRLGLCELLFADRSEVPAKVAINEAIELGKSFGGDKSGGFVNGVLGAVYKEIGEPGKSEKGKRKKKPDVPYEKMPVEMLGGAVVFAREEGDVYLALVHDIFGHWTLSKGRVEEGENVEEGTIREIKEELGLDITIVTKLGENEYVANDPEQGKKRKHVTYFLAEAPFKEIRSLEDKGGLDDAKWFKLAGILDLNFYDDILPIVTKAINLLLKKD